MENGEEDSQSRVVPFHQPRNAKFLASVNLTKGGTRNPSRVALPTGSPLRARSECALHLPGSVSILLIDCAAGIFLGTGSQCWPLIFMEKTVESNGFTHLGGPASAPIRHKDLLFERKGIQIGRLDPARADNWRS